MIRMIIAAILIIAAGAVFFVYTQPTFDSLQSARAQSSEYDQALAKAAELQQLKNSLLSRYNSFNPSDLNRLQIMLPDSVDNIRLILDLNNMAATYGMALQNVVVNAPLSTPTGAISTLSAGGQKYGSLTLQFSTNGTYTQFKQFLGDLERSLRIVDIETISIQSSSAPTAPGVSPSFTYNMTVRTYWLK